MSWKKAKHEKRMCAKTQIERQNEFLDLRLFRNFPNNYSNINNIPLGVYTIKTGNFLCRLIKHCNQIYDDRNEYHNNTFAQKGNVVYFIKNSLADIVQDLTDEFFLNFSSGLITTVNNWVNAGGLELPENLKNSKNWRINYTNLSKWIQNVLSALIQVYVCNCSLAPAKDLKQETGLNLQELQCLYTYFKTNSYREAYNLFGENIFKNVIGNVNPDIDDNQFKIEATNILWNEAEKCLDDYDKLRLKIFNNGNCVSYGNYDQLSKETGNAMKRFFELRKQMKELKFTF